MINYEKIGNGITINGSYIILKNIKISNASFVGLKINGNYNSIINVWTEYNLDSGVKISGHNNYLFECLSQYNFDYKLLTFDIIANKEDYLLGFNSDGFSDKLHKGGSNYFKSCISQYNGDDGFDFFQLENSENDVTILEDCISFANAPKYIDLSGSTRVKHDFNNDETKYIFKSYGCGNGFKLSGKRNKNTIIKHFIKLVNCISASNKAEGFHYNHNNGGMELNNCKSINDRIGFKFLYNKEECEYLKIHQCIDICPQEKGVYILSKNIKNYIND